jgi:glutaredoxin 3
MTITLYSLPTCQWCQMTKKFLQDNAISYTDIDVSTNEEGFIEMERKSEQTGVPVLDIDGVIIVGFQKEKILEALQPK